MKEKKLCVLAVDDSTDVLDLIKFSLEAKTKWRVLLSSSAQEAVIKAKKELPDIILSDYQMPQMNGVEMLRKLRSQPQTKKIPILFLTSIPHFASSTILKEFKLTKTIRKPMDWYSLADLIVLGFQS